ncbi:MULTISPECIES: 50S ribosomal protein L17 [Alicyclobacillus]|uniref:Large ribosomal subunit protein bL17 n=1 Tax=Alicyclobacillus acidoterrestris (strain ATCC 49025 / DSM 3922 / CIP 106132 / NCIMB 13137 / GD3B) TaxID=1356854 RepID=T0D2X8_ALIAG|nr:MULTISPECIES: 50S ribosomal protein L17 [Alicyclobacillus]EPZ45932.1 50S ribosomal protein L17 [Alicyclobacillus acidoterrestris ATCC 49025]UNO49320.1 50S ribosomal protein L17 [Alicyclobacillus acidoterrestris]GEO26757.1 50S ribosomal protein L17 [Alicyclobacillus acidoterrestris]
MAYRKLNRTSSNRKALFRSLVTDLVLYERIQTTEAKAKELRSIADKMITLAKRGDLHARRQVASYVRREHLDNGDEQNQDAIQKLFSVLADRYKERNGGYTRIVKIGPRRGDAAPMVQIELVQ